MIVYSLKDVYEKLLTIKNTSSSNDKVKLLKEYLKDDLFRGCVVLAYSENTNFWINSFKQISEPLRKTEYNFNRIKAALKTFGIKKVDKYLISRILYRISNNTGISDLEKRHLELISSIDLETYHLTELICKKDLNCGINIKTINKAVPNLIYETPYQRCSTMKYFDRIDFNDSPIIQCKANGMFAYLIVEKNGDKYNLTFKSRSGKVFNQLDILIDKLINKTRKMKYGINKGLLENINESFVLMGELRVFEEDCSIMNRQKGNGILTSCLYGTADVEYLDRIFYTIWDYLPLDDFNRHESDISYSDRFFKASVRVSAVDDDRILRLIPSLYVNSKKEANDFYLKMVNEGEEGAIIKNRLSLWKNNTSRDMIKMKPIIEVEMKIVGFTKHLKKPEWMGALELESSDGKVKCLCGSGFTEDDRGIDWKKNIGKIVSIETEGLIQDKKSDIFSLYLPVFIEIRSDKRKANSLKEIQEIELNTSGRKRHV